MELLKRILRALYYFGVGTKREFGEFVQWYLENKRIPRLLRNRAAMVICAALVIGAGWGVAAALGHADMMERTPVQAAQGEPASSSAPTPVYSSQASNVPQKQQMVASAPVTQSASSQAQTVVPKGPRYAQLTAQQLSQAVESNAKQYYEAREKAKQQQASAAPYLGVVYTPPAAGDIAAWKKINSDVIGWISISNTNINYPVVKGAYTDYYTHRGYYKEPSRNGVIWVDSDTRMDAKGNLLSQNTVVYGHNWTNCWRPVRIGNPNDVMFAQLAAYDNADFTAANPYIRLTTEAGDNLYQVFAVFYTDLSFGYTYADLAGNGMLNIINTAKAKSIHKLNVPVGAKDKIITLSTCTRVLGPGSNQRFVVMGKKI